MSFGTPGLLVLMALAPLTAAGLMAMRRWQVRAARRYAGRRVPTSLVPLPSASLWALGTALLTTAVALVALAAARPLAGSQSATVEKAGIDLMVVLDVSQSMEARDTTPSRLRRAQTEVLSLLDRLRGDRVGLVIFARSAVMRSPLSTDLEAVGQLVQGAARDQALLQPGTALAAAIGTAADALTEGAPASAVSDTLAAPTPGRAILVVSDGEDHEGRAVDAGLRAAQLGIRIYTAGVGSREGTLIPEVAPGAGGGEFVPKVDPATGEAIITHLDEGLLRRLASIAEGRYVSLEGNDRPLAALADDFAGLEKAVFAVGRESRPIERFQLFTAVALLVLALSGVVTAWRRWPRPRFAPGVAALAVLGLVGAACAAGAHSLNEKGNRLYHDGSYTEALEAYQRAEAERPDLGELGHNTANALHRLGRFDRAAEEARRALGSADGPLAAKLYYGLGNHLLRAGRLAEALDAYRNALIEDPSDGDAKYNLEVVLRLLEASPPQPTATEGDGQGLEPPGELQPGQGREGQAGEAPPGSDQPGAEGAPEAGQAERIQRDLQQALSGIDENFTVEEALRVLDVLREQQLAQPPLGQQAPAAGPDY